MSNEKQPANHYRVVPVEKSTHRIALRTDLGYTNFVEEVPDSILLTRQELEEELKNVIELVFSEHKKHHDSFNDVVMGKLPRNELYTMKPKEELLKQAIKKYE